MGKRASGTIALVALAAAAGFVALGTARDVRTTAIADGAAVPLAETGVARFVMRGMELADEDDDGDDDSDLAGDHGLVAPTGEPTAIACDDAREVVKQARATLAAPPSPIDPAKFAEATSDWLDPHGLWSVAPDTPVAAIIRASGDKLLAELEAEPGSGDCVTATEIGKELAKWSAELGRVFDEGAAAGARSPAKGPAEAFALVERPCFEDGKVTRNAKDLATALGASIASARAVYGSSIAPFADAARRRAAPSLTPIEWSRVVVAAALRAYVPQLDAHGAWAPMEEETSIYDLSLESDPPKKLWSEMTRTPLGVRIDRGARAPLAAGDVVLEVGGVELAGASVEQADQLSIVNVASKPSASVHVTVLRPGASHPKELSVEVPRDEADNDDDASAQPAGDSPDVALDLVRYGDGRAAVISIADVPDDLGPRLEAAIAKARSGRDLRGVMLDLRANGGGSTDGAVAAIGLFLPGAPLFPMRRRDGGIETERAPASADKTYAGPLAVLVDGDSASAAEMIAGALASYRRAVLLGDRTYGKGCAQEYLDDDAHVGVLRLTTLLFALPDGSPVQKTGLSPNVRLSLPPATEHEASLARALDAWRGPDVRDASMIKDVPWSSHSGHVGPCRDTVVCRALRALGAAPAAKR